MTLALLLSLAVAADTGQSPEPPADTETIDEPTTPAYEGPRHTNPGFGIGVAHLGAVGPPHAHRVGLHLEGRQELPITEAWQLNLTLGIGLTRPQNTVRAVQFAIGMGAWTTQAFVDVTNWAAIDDDWRAFRWMGAFFAYTALATTYLAVPVVILFSPFAMIGHTVAGPTVSWHTAPGTPNAYLEVGLGGSVYGHPITGDPGTALGVIGGFGTQVGPRSVSFRALVAPPFAHDGAAGEAMLSGSLVVGF